MVKVIPGRGRYELVPNLIALGAVLLTVREAPAIVGWVGIGASLVLLVVLHLRFARLYDRISAGS